MQPFYIVLIGVATWYGPGFFGEQLACNGSGWTTRELYYDHMAPPWAAIDPYYIAKGWRCGDTLGVSIDGKLRILRFLDTGPLRRYYIDEVGPGVEIIVDVPLYYWPLPAAVRWAHATVVNRSLATRTFERMVAR